MQKIPRKAPVAVIKAPKKTEMPVFVASITKDHINPSMFSHNKDMFS